MATRLSKWGHSVGLRIPAPVLASANLAAGSRVDVRLLDSGEILVRPTEKLAAVDPAARKIVEPAQTLRGW